MKATTWPICWSASEGTLAFFNEIELDLAADPAATGCSASAISRASTRRWRRPQHIVKLGPAAVELVDRTMIELARDIPMFRATVDRFVQGEPEAILLTEFAGDDPADNLRRLKQLVELMGDLGFPNSVVEATDPAFQSAVWNVRKDGLNIMMSMKGDGKPISFIEDCAVRLEDLAEYTDRLTQVFHKHGTYGTWYAHASVGTLHVRPVINLKQELGAKQMRAIAEEAFAMVREYKGSHSGEHGDGIVRSEFHEPMFGSRIVRAFEEVKDTFDPAGLFNPGKIVRPPKMDDRSLFRFKPGYRHDAGRDRARLVGLGRFRQRRRDVQQQRRLPQIRPRRDVPILSRDRRRAASDARPRQHVAPRLVRPARAGCADLGCDARDDGAVRLVQGLPPRMPDRRRHGEDEDRVSAPVQETARLDAARPADRLSAALRPVGGAVRRVLNLRNRMPMLARAWRDMARASAPAANCREWSSRTRIAALAPAGLGREVLLLVDTFNRYFEPENAPRRRARADPRRLSRHDAGARRRAAVVLRPHLPRGRHGR